jgi:hypothetical protein
MIQYKSKVEASKDKAQPERGKAHRPTASNKTVAGRAECTLTSQQITTKQHY